MKKPKYTARGGALRPPLFFPPLFVPPRLSSFAGYLRPLFGRELFGAGLTALTPSKFPECYGCWILLFGHVAILS